MAEKDHDWGCLYIAVAPVVVALVASGHGDWIIGAVFAVAVGLVVLEVLAAVFGVRRQRRSK